MFIFIETDTSNVELLNDYEIKVQIRKVNFFLLFPISINKYSRKNQR